MRTENLKKLLTGVVTTPLYSSAKYMRVITARNGSFIAANGSSANSTDNNYTYTADYIAQTAAGCDMLVIAMCRTKPGLGISYKSWTETAAYNTTGSYYVPTLCLSATYDSTDTPIASSDYEMHGTDVPCSISINNNTVITVTFSNSGEDVLHANRIGISARLTSRFFLMHIFAFDDIALAPGETKSITIRPDTD